MISPNVGRACNHPRQSGSAQVAVLPDRATDACVRPRANALRSPSRGGGNGCDPSQPKPLAQRVKQLAESRWDGTVPLGPLAKDHRAPRNQSRDQQSLWTIALRCSGCSGSANRLPKSRPAKSMKLTAHRSLPLSACPVIVVSAPPRWHTFWVVRYLPHLMALFLFLASGRF